MAQITCSTIAPTPWSDAPPTYQLHNDVHVYSITISTSLHMLPLYNTLLTAGEQQRANRYYQQKDKERFIVSRVALRILLGQYLQQSPQDIVFTIGENKKPFIANTSRPIHYNVSHAGDRILIAISNSEVGIDIEYTENSIVLDDIIPICFSPEEITHIHSHTDIYRLWTRKEALLKATAKGIDDDIISIPCLDGVREVSFTQSDWKVHSFDASDNYIGSIAHKNKSGQIIFARFIENL